MSETFSRPMDNPEVRSLKGLRVLVAEDNAISQRLVSHVLLQWQVTVDVAANGTIAVEKMIANEYDVVLMDIMMPELDGYDATRAIRSLEGDYFRDLPIFAFSATPDPEQILSCEMTGHLTKSPMDQEELYQRISTYLK